MNDTDPNVSRIYREASTEGPPAALDAAILAAASKRLAQPQRLARSAWVRWMAPASALATLVVAVSLAFLLEREQPARDTGVVPTAPRPQGAAPARAPESAKPQAADSTAPATSKREAPAAAAPAQVPVPAAPEPAPAAALPAPAPPSAPPPAPPPATPPATPPAPAPAEAAAPAAAAFPAESRAKAADSKMSAPKAAKESNVRESNVRESSVRESNVRESNVRESNVSGDSAQGGARSAAPAAAGKVAPLRQQAIQRSPEAWLEEIGRLKREGREQEAAEQLAELRKAYPAFAVPENLLPK